MSAVLYFPTLIWALGLCEYLARVAFGDRLGLPMGFSVWLSIAVAIAAWWRSGWKRPSLSQSLSCAPKLLWVLLALMALILLLSLREAWLPPHLSQEYDAINYHMGLAKQHLYSRSLEHLSWSAGDLWPQMTQWGFAPSWFMTPQPQKLIQFLTVLWGLMLLVRVGFRRSQGHWAGWIPALAVYTTHGVVIQLGTGMLDLAQLYFLIAALDAYQSSRKGAAYLHAGLFCSFKAFSPLQTVAVFGFLFVVRLGLERRGALHWFKRLRQLLLGCAIVTGLLLSRTMWVDLNRAGTPLFPFAVCSWSGAPGCQGAPGEIIRESGSRLQAVRDHYGAGRGPIAVARHLWAVAVPNVGVNNLYDYPLGLSWLLLVVLATGWALGVHAAKRGSAQRPNTQLILAAAFWISWWMGSQQSRWLYPVLALGWLGTLEVQRKLKPQVLCGALALGALVSLISHYRAFAPTLWESPHAIASRMAGAVKWDESGKKLLTQETLYVDRLIPDHAPLERIWILR